MRKFLPVAACAALVAGLVAPVAEAAPAKHSKPVAPAADGARSFEAKARAALAAGSWTVAGRTAAARAGAPDVVVSGLNNPRQLSLGPGGGLYIAEAGRGGDQCFGAGEEAICLGETGAVAFVGRPGKAENKAPRRIITGFFSGAGPTGEFALGATGVSKEGEPGKFYSAFNFVPPEFVPPPFSPEQLGKAIRNTWKGKSKIFADVAAYELAHNPDGENVESNPYAVLALHRRVLVADAAGDSVLSVNKKTGKVSLFAVIDRKQGGRDPVPTSLARGPHRTILVGTLGAGEAPGAGTVFMLDRHGKLLHSMSGFSGIVGLASDKRHGDLYVSELFAGFDPNDPTSIPGQVTKVDEKGHRTSVPVPFPGGVAVDKKGRLYVAAWSIGADTGTFGIPNSSGQVWRMHL